MQQAVGRQIGLTACFSLNLYNKGSFHFFIDFNYYLNNINLIILLKMEAGFG